MKPAFRLAAMLVELFVQAKRRDDNETRNERLSQAKNDPAGYLRQFGRVREVSTPASSVRSNGTDNHRDDIQQGDG